MQASSENVGQQKPNAVECFDDQFTSTMTWNKDHQWCMIAL